jgi:hypothetical protein
MQQHPEGGRCENTAYTSLRKVRKSETPAQNVTIRASDSTTANRRVQRRPAELFVLGAVDIPVGTASSCNAAV